MVTCLLDTAVLVDLLRGHPPARAWITAQEQPGVTPITWLELIEGARDKSTQRQALELLRNFERVEVEPPDFEWAVRQLIRFNLSHGVDAMDCLIASVSYRLRVPLYTQNLKHFIPLLGDLVQKPY